MDEEYAAKAMQADRPDRSPYDIAADALEKSVASLGMSVDSLLQRIVPLLRPVDPSPETTGLTATREPGAPAVSQLQELQDRVGRIEAEIRAALQQLAL